MEMQICLSQAHLGWGESAASAIVEPELSKSAGHGGSSAVTQNENCCGFFD
jgi:hypothetical protein